MHTLVSVGAWEKLRHRSRRRAWARCPGCIEAHTDTCERSGFPRPVLSHRIKMVRARGRQGSRKRDVTTKGQVCVNRDLQSLSNKSGE